MIVSAKDVARIAQEWKASGLRIGLCNGCFDILHVGHLATLEFAAAHCHRLIVAIDDDENVARLKGHGRPINCERERARMVQALKPVDAVVIFSQRNFLYIVESIQPDCMIKGAEYRGRVVEGASLVDEMLFAPMTPCRSSSEAIRRAAACTTS